MHLCSVSNEDLLSIHPLSISAFPPFRVTGLGSFLLKNPRQIKCPRRDIQPSTHTCDILSKFNAAILWGRSSVKSENMQTGKGKAEMQG